MFKQLLFLQAVPVAVIYPAQNYVDMFVQEGFMKV